MPHALQSHLRFGHRSGAVGLCAGPSPSRSTSSRRRSRPSRATPSTEPDAPAHQAAGPSPCSSIAAFPAACQEQITSLRFGAATPRARRPSSAASATPTAAGRPPRRRSIPCSAVGAFRRRAFRAGESRRRIASPGCSDVRSFAVDDPFDPTPTPQCCASIANGPNVLSRNLPQLRSERSSACANIRDERNLAEPPGRGKRVPLRPRSILDET